MFAHTPVRRLYQPRIEPCWDCGDRKVAIAYQVKLLYGHTHYRWFLPGLWLVAKDLSHPGTPGTHPEATETF